MLLHVIGIPLIPKFSLAASLDAFIVIVLGIPVAWFWISMDLRLSLHPKVVKNLSRRDELYFYSFLWHSYQHGYRHSYYSSVTSSVTISWKVTELVIADSVVDYIVDTVVLYQNKMTESDCLYCLQEQQTLFGCSVLLFRACRLVRNRKFQIIMFEQWLDECFEVPLLIRNTN